MEIKKGLTVTRGKGDGVYGGKKGEGSSRNMYKGTMDKPKGLGFRVGGGYQWSSGEWWGEMGTIVLEQQ